MKRLISLAFAATCSMTSVVAQGPPSLTNGRVEMRDGTTPRAVMKEIGQGKSSEWVGWSVPGVSEADDVCCFGSNLKRRGCSLADRDNSWGTTDQDIPGGPVDLYVLVEVKNGAPNRVRLMASTCPIDGANRRVVWLGTITTSASLDALRPLLESHGRGSDVREAAIAAIAYHADPAADALIGKVALDRSLSLDERQQALFWAGSARGASGYKLLEQVLSTDPSGDIREHAVFALTQSSVPGAIDRIKRVSVEDRDPEVRSQALFWLAQSNAEGAGEWIVERLDAEKDSQVREQAVFALSQLKDGTDWLLRVMRSKRDPEIVRQALFWLAQSDDPRALEEIEKILER